MEPPMTAPTSDPTRVPPALCVALLALAALAPAGAARGDVLPLLNASVVASASRAGPILDTQVQTPPSGTPDIWNGSVFSNASDPPNSAFATMFMSFSATTSGLRVFTGGSSTVSDDGVNRGTANLSYFFTSGAVQDADIAVTLTAHDLNGHAGALLFPFEVQGNVPYRTIGSNWGTTTSSIRIPKGIWLVYAWADYDSTAQTGTSPTFSIDATFADCPNPLVTSQPAPQTTPVGSTTSFGVGVSGTLASSASTATIYQWRRNLVPLTDGGRITGATTDQLSISNTAYADSGYYDVIVTQGSVVEGSTLAKLTVSSNTAVDPAVAMSGATLEAPAPNPARGRTTVRFTLPAGLPSGLDVVDVSGRIVRTLLPVGLHETGAGTAAWDGAGESGAPAAPGIYFFRLRAGTQQIVRRIVNLASN
jgi:hypothetical protein